MSSGNERRRAIRRPLIESFSLFVSIPKKGGYKLAVHDISELGIGFDLDLEGEPAEFPITTGEMLEIHFYMNQTLYIPLKVKVMRIETPKGVRRIGAEFPSTGEPAVKAIQSFVQMLDTMVDFVKFDK